MLYSEQITIPANTSESSLVSTSLKLSLGVIHTVWLTFPPGCVGYVKVRMSIDGHPFMPVHKDAYIRGNDFTFAFPVMFEITDEPMTLTIEAWSAGSSYAHSIQVVVLVLPKKLILPAGATEGILEGMKSLIIRPLVIQQTTEAD